jgi:hypothetical protein
MAPIVTSSHRGRDWNHGAFLFFKITFDANMDKPLPAVAGLNAAGPRLLRRFQLEG